MAHFAELDSNNIVLRVLVLDNSMILNAQGIEQEQFGIDFLKGLFGNETIWKQTSYNGNLRKNYAGIGYTYNTDRDAFINPKPIVEPNMEQYLTFSEEDCFWYFIPPQPDLQVTRIK